MAQTLTNIRPFFLLKKPKQCHSPLLKEQKFTIKVKKIDNSTFLQKKRKKT